MVESAKPEQQFDFWLGEWDVTWGEDRHGTSRVDKILNDKVILEQFDGNPAMPFRGMSLSAYDARAELWCQTWVDTEGDSRDLNGEGGNGRTFRNRSHSPRLS